MIPVHVKRETSLSVSDLHMNSLSVADNSAKRPAIDVTAESQHQLHLKLPSSSSVNITTILSTDTDSFQNKYQIGKEIGKGGFSMVYQCREIATGVISAVKIIDLRPLRLRARFNPNRLRREVDIMKKLHHPNIIRFVDVFESTDYLMLIMEYCPGQELFDVILAQSRLEEDDAKCLFSQIANALHYLHCMNIIHRDIKPENVQILFHCDPVTGLPIAKLLDFGLSKNAGGGSAAKTFVGTPCYQAPEVQLTSKGLGGTYGLPADCWSLGAVLYVMLVARFPEFVEDILTNKLTIKFPSPLWDDISLSAKSLIAGLMEHDPAKRMTMDQALQHPWLGTFQRSSAEVLALRSACQLSNSDQQPHNDDDSDDNNDNDNNNQHVYGAGSHAMDLGHSHMHQHMPSQVMASRPVLSTPAKDQLIVVHNRSNSNLAGMVNNGNNNNNSNSGGGSGNGTPRGCSNTVVAQYCNSSSMSSTCQQVSIVRLKQLQMNIELCFEVAHTHFKDMPELAAKVRQGAILCRQQLNSSKDMLRKVQETANRVPEVLGDLELAMEEGAPELASGFFSVVRGWVSELRQHVSVTQAANRASMLQVQVIVEQSVVDMQTAKTAAAPTSAVRETMLGLYKAFRRRLEHMQPYNHLQITASSNTNTFDHNAHVDQTQLLPEVTDESTVSAEQLVEMMLNMFTTPISTIDNLQPAHILDSSTSSAATGMANMDTLHRNRDIQSPPLDMMMTMPPLPASPVYLANSDNDSVLYESMPMMAPSTPSGKRTSAGFSSVNGLPPPILIAPNSTQFGSANNDDLLAHPQSPVPSSAAATQLHDALHQLRDIDLILDTLNDQWGQTELVLDKLTKQGQHVEQFVGFAKTPKLLARFKDRLHEYVQYWQHVAMMCKEYCEDKDLCVNTADGGSNVHNHHQQQQHLQQSRKTTLHNNNSNISMSDSTGITPTTLSPLSSNDSNESTTPAGQVSPKKDPAPRALYSFLDGRIADQSSFSSP